MGNIFKSLFKPKAEKSADEKNFEIFKYDGVRAMRTGKIEYAIKCFEQALKINEEKEVLTYLTSAYLANHQTEEALQTACRHVEIEPENINAMFSRAALYFQNGHNSEALADCISITETDKTDPLVFLLTGRIKKAISDFEGAIDVLSEAITLKADLADAYILRAEMLNELNRSDEALEDIEKFMELAPEEESAFLLKGQIFNRAGRIAEAAELYANALELNPYNEEAAILKARLLINEGRMEEVILFLDEVIEIIPNSAKAYLERAAVKRLKGDVEGASEDETMAAELQPDEDTEGSNTNFKDMYKGGLY